MTPLTIQMTRWLRQAAVWRFIGLVSTIVGLLCYALSSSFSYLFGEWNLFKIFLYSVFSLFICFWSLIAKVCQRSTSLRFKAHSAFLVLTITSVYSYFADKAVNGKPDVYSVISCAAFAIMSLSLSRQTECGFEADLFYFFLGCLIVLLMKINLALAIVGVGFSYALIILRSSLDTTSYHNLAVQDDHSTVIDVNSLHSTADNASMMQQLMACVTALRQGNLNITNMLLDRTKEYFRLYEYEPEGIDHNFMIDALSLGKINDLHKTIKLMVDNGFEKECCEVYCNWRRESLEECLISLFGMQEIINMKGQGNQLEEYIIERWIVVLKVALRILFPSEQRLIHVVFSGFSSVAELCFTAVCKGAIIQLLNIVNVVASGSPSQRRLSKIIDMFVKLSHLIAEFQSYLPESLVKEVMTMQDKLGEASRDIFMKMENMIFRVPEVKAIAPANGKVHPMTTYVVDYVVFAHQAKRNLEHILRQYPVFINGAVVISSVSDQIDRIMKRLERKLVAISKNYNNPSLRYFFLMNNWSELELRLHLYSFRKATTIFQQNPTIFQQNLELYQSSSWNMVLDFLKLENNEFVEPNANAQSIKDNLDLFNKHFEEICSTQSTWFASDMLREHIILTLQNILVPAYGIFIGRFQDILGNQHADKYIKYGIFGVRDQLNDLFLGSMPKKLKLKEKERWLSN